MTLLSNFASQAANRPSAIAATDRALARPKDERLVSMMGLEDASSSSNTNATTSTATTSNHPQIQILACSVPPTGKVQSLQAKLLAARRKNELLVELEKGVDADGYPFCQYRKGFWDHLKGKALAISTIRVSIQQATTILVSFITDQLELDLKRNVKVNEGELTQLEADEEAEEWEKFEWHRRWKTFPNKFLMALIKYHAVTLILRSYEFIASKLVNLKKLDKLTTDPFAISKRLSQKLNDQNQDTKTAKHETLTMTISMTQTALWANLLPFFSDYSLHQGLLCYGYYKYYNYQRQKRLAQASDTTPADPDEQVELAEAAQEAALEERNVLVADLMEKSSRLAGNRGLGWIGSAVGAGIGSVVWAGWGTILVSSLGDVAAGAVLDDGYHKARTDLEAKQHEEEAQDQVHRSQVQ